MKLSIRIIIFLFYGIELFAQVITYPAPPNVNVENPYIFPSQEYKVVLIQNGKELPEFVYSMNAMHTTNNSKTTAWASFSFKDKIQVKVEKLNGEVDFAQVLPIRSGIKTTVSNDKKSIIFDIEKPGHYSVEFQEGIFIEHPLMIFANSLEENTYQHSDENVIYFGPGFYEIGEDFEIQSNQTLYLAGGAYVKGQINASNVKNVKIIGRGIISGEDYEPRTHNHMIQMKNADSIFIEGITMIHSPRYMIALNGQNHHLKNIKMMGWWFSTDGISAGENTLIEKCFFKVNDDAVKLYRSNTIVKDCVIWQMENGAPFMISWNGSADFGNCSVSNIDVIRVEHHWDNENLAVVCAVHGGKANISNFKFSDIRIYNSKWRLFHLVTRPNRWGKWDPEQGTLSQMVFQDIEMFGEQNVPSLIMGHDKNHKVGDIHFKNIRIGGKSLKDLEKPNFIVDENTTYNITIK